MAIAAFALVNAVYYVLETLIWGVSVPGFASLIVSIMFFAGVQLISLGVLGEYIGRIFAEVKGRPLYIVAEKIGGAAPSETSPAKAAKQRKDDTSHPELTAAHVQKFPLGQRVHAALPADRISARRHAQRPASAPACWATPSPSRCACPIISAPFSARARSTPPMCRPICASTRNPTSGRRAISPTRSSLCCCISQIVILALGWLFMPGFIRLLAPGFAADPAKFDLAVSLTRITFPYLFCVTLVTMHSATLNAHGKFAVAAFAPVLLNVVTMAFLAVAFLFPNAAYAAAAGVTASGDRAACPADGRRAPPEPDGEDRPAGLGRGRAQPSSACSVPP